MPSEPKMLYLATAREDHAKDGTLITNFSGKFLLEYREVGSLELILLQPQTFALYRDVQVWNGASPNQLKPIHVITNPKTEAFFRGLKIST